MTEFNDEQLYMIWKLAIEKLEELQRSGLLWCVKDEFAQVREMTRKELVSRGVFDE